MFLGMILLLIGVPLIIGNKRIAVMTGTPQRGYFNEFRNSVARQNIAIIGILLSLAGLAAVLFL